MPESATHKIPINLNLLKPQSESPKNVLKFVHWALFVGRYIVVFVEIVVLSAFLVRFKLDADIDNIQTQIDEQVKFIDSLKNVETEVRQTQFQISNVKKLQGIIPDFVSVLKHVADQAPTASSLTNLTVEAAEGTSTVKITGNTQSNTEISAFTQALQGDPFFSNVALTSVSLEQNIIKFVIQAVAERQGGT